MTRPETRLPPPDRPAYRRRMAAFMSVIRRVRHRAVAAGVGLAPAH
jgi:hypothetical protein